MRERHVTEKHILTVPLLLFAALALVGALMYEQSHVEITGQQIGINRQAYCFDNDNDQFSGNALVACAPWDCNDNDASIYPGATENCKDHIDQDCDHRADCEDIDCDTKNGGGGRCEYGTEVTCNDGFDNDADMFIDAADDDCDDDEEIVTLAIFGDYGCANQGCTEEEEVSDLVHSWSPTLVVTTGDNNYPDGEQATIDPNIGQHYQDFIYPYFGTYGNGAPDQINRFFPALGNHDYVCNGCPTPYIDYFTLPGNERYYDYRIGDVHIFIVNSEADPDGNDIGSVQYQWLEAEAQASDALWKFVFMHKPPYSSKGKFQGDSHGSNAYLQWPYSTWGIDAVFAAHKHMYERLFAENIPYYVVGTGGKNLDIIDTPIPESQIQYDDDHGAELITITGDTATLEFWNIGTFNGGTPELIDSITLTA